MRALLVPLVLGLGQAPALPPDASADARELWQALLTATRPTAAGGARAPVTAFDLAFDGRLRSGEKATNDFNDARYRFYAPDCVRTTLESGVERMRGPEGDWLVDWNHEEKVKLVGRDFDEDRRELDETLDVARNFVALTDPARLDVKGLRLLPAAPAYLPSELAKLTTKLAWLEVESPGLRLTRGSAAAQGAVYKAHLGLDRERHLPRIAVIFEDRGGRMDRTSALLVELDEYAPLDDFQVPHVIRTYPTQPPGPETLDKPFAERWELGIWLKKGARLRAALAPADFVPPAKF
jgi:hypothetical protein